MKVKEGTANGKRFTSTASEIGKPKFSSSANKAKTAWSNILNEKNAKPKTVKKK